MRRTIRQLSITISAMLLLGSGVAYACTSFLLSGSDGGYVYGRTMEFGMDLESKVIAVPRQFEMQGTGIDGTAGSGLAWTTKYAAVGASAFGMPIIVDGMNEKGLVGGLLYAPNISQYQEVSPEDSDQSLASYEMLTFALTNFATVDEARDGFTEILVNQAPQEKLGIVPLHVTLHDASGNSIVIEYIDGELQVSDNPIGVLTNAPRFDWHLTNLGNYVGLSTGDPGKMEIGSATFSSPSSGGGMTGLPGDFSSPSRFVRAALMTKNAPTDRTTEQQVATAFHFLNNFDIPPGMVALGGGFAGGGDDGGDEITYWSSVSDNKNQVFYMRLHNNPSILAIEMAELDLDAEEIREFDLDIPWKLYFLTGE